MKKIILIFTFLVAFISCAFTQVIDLSPEETRYDLKVLNTNITSAYCSEYQAVYDALTTKPSDAIAAEQNTMVCGWVGDGVWSKNDILYVFAQTTNAGGEALVNWINPGTFDAVEIPNGGALIFTALEGFTGDLSAYTNTNWSPGDGGVHNYTRNDAVIGCYNRNKTSSGMISFGAFDAAANGTFGQFETNRMLGRFNSALFTAVVDTYVAGMDIFTRDNSADFDYYNNNVKTDVTKISVAIADFDFYIHGYNFNDAVGGQSSHQISMVFAGSSFTPTNINNMTDRFEVYMDSNGKGVIP